MKEVRLQSRARQLVLLVEQFALGEHHQAVALAEQLLQCVLNARQGRAGKLQQAVALLQYGVDGGGGHLVAADAHGRLKHAQCEGFHAVAQQRHVLALGGKEFHGSRLAVSPRRQLVV